MKHKIAKYKLQRLFSKNNRIDKLIPKKRHLAEELNEMLENGDGVLDPEYWAKRNKYINLRNKIEITSRRANNEKRYNRLKKHIESKFGKPKVSDDEYEGNHTGNMMMRSTLASPYVMGDETLNILNDIPGQGNTRLELGKLIHPDFEKRYNNARELSNIIKREIESGKHGNDIKILTNKNFPSNAAMPNFKKYDVDPKNFLPPELPQDENENKRFVNDLKNTKENNVIVDNGSNTAIAHELNHIKKFQNRDRTAMKTYRLMEKINNKNNKSINDHAAERMQDGASSLDLNYDGSRRKEKHLMKKFVKANVVNEQNANNYMLNEAKKHNLLEGNDDIAKLSNMTYRGLAQRMPYFGHNDRPYKQPFESKTLD